MRFKRRNPGFWIIMGVETTYSDYCTFEDFEAKVLNKSWGL